MRVFRSKSEEIDDEDVQYYHTERCAEAGEEYDPKLKWLESESESCVEVNDDWSSGCSSEVLEGSSSEYFAPSGISNSWPITIKLVCPSGGGYAPDVRSNYRDVGDGLVGPGVSGGSGEKSLEDSQGGWDRHF